MQVQNAENIFRRICKVKAGARGEKYLVDQVRRKGQGDTVKHSLQ